MCNIWWNSFHCFLTLLVALHKHVRFWRVLAIILVDYFYPCEAFNPFPINWPSKTDLKLKLAFFSLACLAQRTIWCLLFFGSNGCRLNNDNTKYLKLLKTVVLYTLSCQSFKKNSPENNRRDRHLVVFWCFFSMAIGEWVDSKAHSSCKLYTSHTAAADSAKDLMYQLGAWPLRSPKNGGRIDETLELVPFFQQKLWYSRWILSNETRI